MIATVKICLYKKVVLKVFDKCTGVYPHLSTTFIKLQLQRQQFTNIALHHDRFSGMFRKFYDQHCGLSIRGCPCPDQDESEINHTV